MTDRFADWMRDLKSRHLADLTFAEVSRSLRALSSSYVERRGRLAEGAALAGAGKRAAFALFYGPLHYLLVHNIVSALDAAKGQVSTLVDLGCGSGAAGAAWAAALGSAPHVVGIDRHPWPLAEAAHTYRDSASTARTRQGDVARVEWSTQAIGLPGGIRAQRADRRGTGSGVVATLRWDARPRADCRTAGRVRRTVVAAMARRRSEGWRPGERVAIQGRAPAIVAKLDRAAGLNHREITGRSLWIAPPLGGP